MKRRHVGPSNEDELIVNKKTVGNLRLNPLDATNLRLNWPRWKQNFTIFILPTFEDLPDQRRLDLFLAHLGAQGAAIANSLLPDPVKDTTECLSFDQVFTTFDEYCTTSSNPTTTRPSLADVYKFHAMTLEGETLDDLKSLHTRLIAQADLCGFTSSGCNCVDRLVRDRLLVAAAAIHPECLEINKDDPQVEDIFVKYQQVIQTKLVWTYVIPYLSLRDLESLWQLNATLAALIKDHLVPHTDLIIDAQCLREYPVALHASVYKKYSRFTNSLVLCEVPETDIPTICAIFKNLYSLTLRRIHIAAKETPQKYPCKFRTLKLVQCVIENSFLTDWFKGLGPYLNEMHIECPSYSLYCPKVTIEDFVQLESLSYRVPDIIGDNWSLYINLKSLKRAKIIGMTGTHLKLECPKLEKLELNVIANFRDAFEYWNSNISGLKTLKSLTLINWQYGKYNFLKPVHIQFWSQFKALEHIKIFQSVDPRCRTDIAKKNFPLLKTRTIHFWEEKPRKPNLILTLNDDCLLHVMQYLPIDDQISLFETHPRFESVFKTLNSSGVKLEIRSYDLKRLFKLRPETLKYLYECVNDVVLTILSSNDTITPFKFLKFLKDLKKLDFQCGERIIREKSFVGFPTIEELVVDGFNLPPLIFPQLEHSLHTLDLADVKEFRNSDLDALVCLKNVRKLVLPCMLGRYKCTDKFNQFIWQNSDHMEYIDISELVGDTNKFWQGVRAMKRLKHLSAYIGGKDHFERQLQGQNNFPDLESLKLWKSSNDCRFTSEKCVAISRIFARSSKLRKFKLETTCSEFVVYIEQHFKSLLELEITWICGPMTVADVQAFCSMKNLQKLKFTDTVCGSAKCYHTADACFDNSVITLIKELPHLMELTTNRTIGIDVVPEIKEFLKRENRTLIMKGCFESEWKTFLATKITFD